ncbi:unnamed protein product [Phytomonas sp. Hart1]|nr:unnamed protein product [Phytomonas sp. Hart1]|eukprot:CCW66849.1 unnamed protein product [Phytomonas sp. isolate Hart1]
MFQEALDFALSFVAIHLENEGCTLATLGEFLDKDVFPFCGWASNHTLLDSVVRLLINEFSSEVRFVLQSLECHNNGEPLKMNVSISSGQGSNSSTTPNMSSNMCLQKKMTPSELTRMLDEKRTLWEDTSPESVFHLVHICPSHELREKVLGIPIRTCNDRQTIDYVSENALYGCSKVVVKTKLPAKYKQYVITAGIARMYRNRMLSMYYLMDSTTHELTCRYFPWYAAPLTELEKTELGTLSALQSPNNENLRSGTNRTPQELIHQRNIKGYQPINHYFWRLRQANSNIQNCVFDLKAIKHIVRSSPERKLLYQDAIHTIFMVHGLHPHRVIEIDKRNRMRLRHMLIAAGLRILQVTILVHNRPRKVSIVIPEEDLYKFAISTMRSVKRAKLEENAILSSIECKLKEENVEYENEDVVEPEGEKLNETADNSPQTHHNALKNDSVDRESDTSICSMSASASDDENASISRMDNVCPKKENFQEMNETQKRSKVAATPLYISAGWPFELQFAKEAERRPISLMVAYPRMVFRTSDKMRVKALSLYMTNYIKHGTLETYYTLAAKSTSFTLVYAPKAKPPKSVVNTGPDDEPTENTPLPAGTSQYSIDVVLDALKASPHKALSIRDLTNIIGIKPLQHRVIPYLRLINRVTTTGITLKNRERVGIVVLAGTILTEDEKHAVVEASHNAVVPEEHMLLSVAQSNKRQLKLDVLLPNIPATVDGVGKSVAHLHLSNPNFRMVATARKIMTIRNGYARSALYRAGRLHLELWKQWHDGIHQSGCGSTKDTKMYSMSAQDIYDNMSLSTFCIVVGFAALDLTAVLAEYCGHDTHSTSGKVSWVTPLRLLPPSLNKICQDQGVQPLLHGLSILQSHGLIRSDEILDCFITKKLQEITIELECYGIDLVRNSTIVLHDNTRYSPSMTMCAVLRYWFPIWARSVKHSAILHISELYEAEPNPTIETLVAMNRRLRFDLSILAESFYQSCGMNRSLPFDALSQKHRKDEKTRLSSGLLQHGKYKRRGHTRQAAFSRKDTSGVTLAKDLESVLSSPLPHKRLWRILSFLKRLSRVHLSGIPTGLPSLHDAFLTSLQHHAFSVNPYTNHSAIHLCVLGEALQHVLQHSISCNENTTETALSSLQKNFSKCISLVFSPNASGLPVGSLVDSPGPQSPSTPDDLDFSRENTPRAPKFMEASDYEEVMLDSLRMILLSDAAHYNSAIAKELVLAFPAKLVARGRNYLQKEPSFSQRCWKRSHRIPELTLSARPFIFSPHITRPAPRPCANTMLIHSWVSRLHDMINNVTAGTTRREFKPCFTCSSSPNSHFDILVASQPVMDVEEIPLLAREDDVMATLRAPTLIWPASARVSEQSVRRTLSVSLEKDLRGGRKRQREEYDDADSNIIDKDLENKFADDEENDTNAEVLTQSFANDLDIAASATLYPARTLVRWNGGDIDLADCITIDPMPTAEEADAVKKNISHIAASKGEPQGSLSLCVGQKNEARYPLAYPSVFHHVDGAFHVFMWKLFLLSIYRYILYVPGVLYTTLRKRAMSSGLISARALNAALHFLVDSTVLVRKSVLTAVGGVEDCYTTTTLEEGLWDIIKLD